MKKLLLLNILFVLTACVWPQNRLVRTDDLTDSLDARFAAAGLSAVPVASMINDTADVLRGEFVAADIVVTNNRASLTLNNVNNTTVGDDLIPVTDNAFDLGSLGKSWKVLFGQALMFEDPEVYGTILAANQAPSALRTIVLPNASGTVMLTSDTTSLSDRVDLKFNASDSTTLGYLAKQNTWTQANTFGSQINIRNHNFNAQISAEDLSDNRDVIFPNSSGTVAWTSITDSLAQDIALKLDKTAFDDSLVAQISRLPANTSVEPTDYLVTYDTEDLLLAKTDVYDLPVSSPVGVITDSLAADIDAIGIDSTSISADSLFFWIGGNKYKAVKSSFPYWILLGLPFLLLRRRKL